jgi:hypothetical protein
MSVLEFVAIVAIVGYVIGRQLLGEHLRGKRLIMLPVLLSVIGGTELFGHGHHLRTADISLIVVGAIVAAAIGIGQGSMMRLQARDGTLWGQMPRRSLWLWLALLLSRVVLIVVASQVGAHVAASTAPILLTLGINRLAQAAVVAPRALAAGIPFTPEKHGSTFLAQVFGSSDEHSKTDGDGRHDLASITVPPMGNPLPGGQWQSGMRILADRLAGSGRPR